MTKRRATLAYGAALTLLTMAAGCHKKAAPPPPPPPPASAPVANKPTISYFSAEPSSVNSGQPASLRWSVTDATTVEIDNNIGTVSPSGRRAVYPTETTTYTLTATSSAGTATATTTVTVSTAPPPAAPPAAATPTASEILAKQVQDVHFDYDKSDVRPEDQPVLQADANALKTIVGMDASFVITIEGHCDERGSAEYNLGLGDRRASAVKEALVGLGIPAEKLKTISYGKERPLCTDAAEECYARNRRAHFAAGQ
jgi:peptidoglycan-associated lipoprotein